MAQMAKVMREFGERSEDLEVRAAFMNESIGAGTSTATPEDAVNSLLQEVATENSIEMSAELAGPGSAALPSAAGTARRSLGGIRSMF